MWLEDIISMSVGILVIIPLFLYAYTGNSVHIKALFGLLGTMGLSEGLKYNLIGNRSLRPKGARNCNLFCNDGKQEGRPGMPSSHSAEVVFFTSFYSQYTENNYIRGGLILYAVFVMLSRYTKRCHSLSQITAGTIIGLAMSWTAMNIL